MKFTNDAKQLIEVWYDPNYAPVVSLNICVGQDKYQLDLDEPEDNDYAEYSLRPDEARTLGENLIAWAEQIERDREIPGPKPAPTTPAHTSHESLVSLAKAIAYLPASLRDELNALLAVKLREALK